MNKHIFRTMSSYTNCNIIKFKTPKAMFQNILELTEQSNLIRNYIGMISNMKSKSLYVTTDLFPEEALDFYTKHNLGVTDPDNSSDKLLYDKFYNSQRGGGQGDYRDGIQNKIANVVDCLNKFPNSKRAVLTIPCSNMYSKEVRHSNDEEAKCLRELHFYIDPIEDSNDQQEKALCCTGFMRAQAAIIFPKNIHFIGTVMNFIANELKLPVGTYTHFVTTLVGDRS